MRFTYENQGAETMLVWKLEEGEHLDSLAKGMLQGNEINGILKPAFMQRDRDQYLKYPVTSKITLDDYLNGEVERENLLNILLSLAGAEKELTEYMLDPEKLVLDPSYIFVDIRRKAVGMIYIPVDEFSQTMSIRDFLTGLISHTRFKEDGDLSYVAKLLTFLNQQEPWGVDALELYIRNLLAERIAVSQPQAASGAAVKPEAFEKYPAQQSASKLEQPMLSKLEQPVIAQSAQELDFQPGQNSVHQLVHQFVQKPASAQPEPRIKLPSDVPLPLQKAPQADVPNMAIPEVPMVLPSVNEKKKKDKHLIDLFVKPAKEKKEPSMQEKKEKKSEKKADNRSEKKGLFGRKKKVEEKPMVVPEIAIPGGIPEISQRNREDAGVAASQFRNEDNHFFREEIKETPPIAKEEGLIPFSGQGSSEEEATVIMGGNDQYEATVILGGEKQKRNNVNQRADIARIIRKRTGQSMIIDQGVLRIGSEGSFVDFYIADNPAIGACHAEITKKNQEWYLTDRNSANHTYLNGSQISPMQAVRLSSGDRIQLANEEFEFFR